MEEQKGNIDIGGSVGAGAAIGNNATVNATNIAGRDINYYNVPRPVPPAMPKLIVGRSIDSKKLEKLLTDNKEEHITVLGGSRGVGKTALAALVANRLLYQFPDCLWADIAEYRKEPLSLLKRFIRQLGHSAEGLDIPNSAAIFLKDIMSNLRVLVVLDNVEGLDELKDFIGLVDKSQSSILVVSSEDKIITQLSSETLILDPLKERDAVSLFNKLSKLPSSKNKERVLKIVQYCHRLPGLICPIASQVKSDGIKGLEKWEQQIDQSESDLKSSDAVLIFHSIYRDLSDLMKKVIRISAIIAPAKLNSNLLAALFDEDKIENRALLNELANLKLLKKLGTDLYEPDFLLRSNFADLTQKDNEYEELYLGCHNYFISQVSVQIASDGNKITNDEYRDAQIFFNKAVQNERWDIVRDCSRLIQRQNSFQMNISKNSLFYGSEADPFPNLNIVVNDSKVIKFSAPGGSGNNLHIENASLFFIDFNGCLLNNVHIVNSTIGNFELSGASINNFHCENSILSNVQIRGTELNNFHFEQSQIFGLDLRKTQAQNFHFEKSFGSDINISDGEYNTIYVKDSQMIEVRLEGTRFERFVYDESSLVTSPDKLQVFESSFDSIYKMITAREDSLAKKKILEGAIREIESALSESGWDVTENNRATLSQSLRLIREIAPDVFEKVVEVGGNSMVVLLGDLE